MISSGKAVPERGAPDPLSRIANNVSDHPVLDAGVRAGYAVNGILHLLIAWLGLQVALGRTGANADPAGAVALVAGPPWD